MNTDKSVVITQVLSVVVGTAIVAIYLYGAYRTGKKEFTKTLKTYQNK